MYSITYDIYSGVRNLFASLICIGISMIISPCPLRLLAILFLGLGAVESIQGPLEA